MRRRDDRGQATVELALVLPILVVMLAGIVWIGQVMTIQVQLEHAAREGARAAAVEPQSATSIAAGAVARVNDDFRARTTLGSEFVTVEVAVDIPGLPIIGLGARTLHADVSMRREDLIA